MPNARSNPAAIDRLWLASIGSSRAVASGGVDGWTSGELRIDSGVEQ